MTRTEVKFEFKNGEVYVLEVLGEELANKGGGSALDRIVISKVTDQPHRTEVLRVML